MSEAKESKPAKQIVDVEHPGKTAPPLTSRPVIVTNRAILKDPMMVADGKTEPTDVPQTEDAPNTKPKLDVKGGKVPVMNHDAATVEANPTKSDEAAPTKDEAKTTPAEPESDKTDKTNEEAAPADVVTKDSLPDEDGNTNSTTNGAQLTDAQMEAEAAADAKRDAELEKLIDSKKYYVPVNAVEKRRTKRVIALGIVLAIVLAVAWVDVAMDAGLISIGSVKPVTHFFSN